MADAPLRRVGSPGAVLTAGQRCHFRVWAPARDTVEVVLVDEGRAAELVRGEDGVHRGVLTGIEPGTRYVYRLDRDLERPDPASRHQPDGVHGPSAVVDRPGGWTDAGFRPAARADLVVYELHVGTFTRDGTFTAAIPHLDRLAETGINALELMPVAQFPGQRNWGYDGVYPFAVQDSYGGRAGLAALVDACHARGIAVILDVVYNHFGPEGCYLSDFGPYFDDSYRTPWGRGLNLEGPGSDAVRWYFTSAACSLLEEFHLDGFRVDAVHAFKDTSARPFLAELTAAIHRHAARTGRAVQVIAESDLNDSRVPYPAEVGGYAMDAQWSDDFHHALHALLTGERDGYYRDFGRLEDLAEAFRAGWVYAGRWSVHRQRCHGNSPAMLGCDRFVVYAQTHDQVGNRARGDRLSAQLSLAQQKLVAATVLLSPFVPMLFMGEEYGETAPFRYFTSHGDEELGEAVRRGRQQEFAGFGWDPEDVPDPQAPATFDASKLQPELLGQEPHATLWRLHRELIQLRRHLLALREPDKSRVDVRALDDRRTLVVHRWWSGHEAVILLVFGDGPVRLRLALAAGEWQRVLDTEEPQWQGGGSALADAVHSAGEIEIELPGWSCVLLARLPEPTDPAGENR